MKKTLLLSILFVTVLGLGACPKEKKEDTAPPAGTEGATAPSGDSIGVPECDTYISKYTSCIMDKVPEAGRDMMKSSLDQSLSAWKQAAATPEGKAGLAMACKTAMDAAKQSMGMYGCQW